jgi:AraC-like DNA-binding protein
MPAERNSCPARLWMPSAMKLEFRASATCTMSPGVSTDDPVVRHLLASLLPATAKPEEAHPLFLDHVALALTADLVCTYGGMNPNAGLPRGGLAPWQEKRVKELTSATPQEEVPLSRLATECNLSVRHFARAFRQSTWSYRCQDGGSSFYAGGSHMALTIWRFLSDQNGFVSARRIRSP